MYLIGDIGNTETKLRFVNKDFTKDKKIYFETKKISNQYLSKKLKKYEKKINIIDKIIICSVVPSALGKIKKYFKNKTVTKCIELKDLSFQRLINVKANKKQIGSDRIANALSISNYKDNFIVVDFGTATTFDVIVKKTYLGGVIAPGIEISLRSLSLKASLIPKIKFQKIKTVIGKTTSKSVLSGFYWGYNGLIDKIIDLIHTETKKKFRIILTGGLSHLFTKSISYNNKLDKDLTLDGLLKLIKYLKQNE